MAHKKNNTNLTELPTAMHDSAGSHAGHAGMALHTAHGN